MKQRDMAKNEAPKGASLLDDPSLKEASAKADKVLDSLKDQFKSASELGLNDLQYEGLIKVLDYLENTSVQHNPREEQYKGLSFNMSIWRNHHSCGSVCCIGGSAEALVGADKGHLYPHDSTMPRELNKLFFGGPGVWRDTTPKQAAVALRGYLEIGITDWYKAKGLCVAMIYCIGRSNGF